MLFKIFKLVCQESKDRTQATTHLEKVLFLQNAL